MMKLPEQNEIERIFAYLPEGLILTFTYDTAKHPESEAATIENLFAYNCDGRIPSKKVRANWVSTYQYDIYGNLTNIIRPEGWVPVKEKKKKEAKSLVEADLLALRFGNDGSLYSSH